MNSVCELISCGAEQISREDRFGLTDYRTPQYPACVFYLGADSSQFAESVQAGLIRGWGNKAHSLAFFDVPNTDWFNDSQSIRTIQTRIQGMMEKTVFVSRQCCEVFCILDTEAMDSQDFRAWYMTIQKVAAAVPSLELRTMLMVLLKSSVNSTATDIKQEVDELYRDSEVGNANAHIYDGLFMVGNGQFDGGFSEFFAPHNAGEHGAWDILPDIILLADSDSRACNKALLSSKRVGTTAAFKQVAKPAQDITKVTLRDFVLRLNDYKQRVEKASLSADTIDDVLGYSKGMSVDLGEATGYVDQVLAQFNGFERGLPSTQLQANMAALAYSVASDLSCGCLDAFVEQNHVQMFGNLFFKAGFEGLAGKIEQRITSTLNAPQLLSLSLDAWHEQIRNRFGYVAQVEEEVGQGASLEDALRGKLLQITRDALAQSDIQVMPVEQAIRHVLGTIAKEAIAQTLISTIDAVYIQAQETDKAFVKVLSDVMLEANVAQNDLHQKIDTFYGDVVSNWLGGGAELQSVANQVFAVGNGEGQILNALYRQGLLPLFQSSYGNIQVFKLEFMDELVVRMGEGVSQEVAQTVVGKDLVEGMADLIAYQSQSRVPFQSQLVEAYLINSHAGPAARQLKDYLDQQPLPAVTQRVFMDGVSADSVTSIWIYPLTEEQLQCE